MGAAPDPEAENPRKGSHVMHDRPVTRRQLLAGSANVVAASTLGALLPRMAHAQ